MQLYSSFPKLTEANQHYMLGIAEGLKHAQDKQKEQLDGQKAENPSDKPPGQGEKNYF